MTGRSRYADCRPLTLGPAGGTTADARDGGVAYLAPRMPPAQPDAPLAWHRVRPEDRLDLIATRYLGDPRAAWRICDANLALDPQELTGPDAVDRMLVIPVPRPAG